MQYISKYDSPFGEILIAADDKGLTGLWFIGQKYFADTLEDENEEKETPVLSDAAHWLDIYFSGEEPDFTPSLNPHGTDFRMAVWRALLEIPYGQTTTYGMLAKKTASRLGLDSMSAQAVGGAVGHNPISIIIPCHRVLGSDGSLTGYAGGIDRKKALLTLEQTIQSR